MKRMIPIAVIVSLVFFSCSKDGPAGPVGPAGPTGGTGASGPSGPAGPPGTANVIYSDWLDVIYDSVTNNAGDTVFAYIDTISAPKLDNSILTNGEIKIYLNWGTAAEPAVEAIPLLDLFYFPGLSIYPTFSTGLITLVANGNISTVTTTNGKVRQYRYILIPGGTPAVKAPNLDWSNYSAVKSYLKLTN